MTRNGDRSFCPVQVDLAGRLVVIVGGGSVAERAVRFMTGFGSDVLVVAPLVTSGIDALVAEGVIEHEQRGYVRGDLAGAVLAVCATDSLEVDRAVHQEAEGAGCLVCIDGSPELSSFAFEFAKE